VNGKLPNNTLHGVHTSCNCCRYLFEFGKKIWRVSQKHGDYYTKYSDTVKIVFYDFRNSFAKEFPIIIIIKSRNIIYNTVTFCFNEQMQIEKINLLHNRIKEQIKLV
jgi:hypothetical protein